MDERFTFKATCDLCHKFAEDCTEQRFLRGQSWNVCGECDRKDREREAARKA